MIDADESRTLVSDDGVWVSRRVFGDEAVYQRELRTIYERCWLFLGHESQIRNVGDFFASYMGEVPVLVTRGKDQKVHCVLNSCAHRGIAVCRADQGNTKSFICPYHRWSYGLDGTLLGVPERKQAFGENFDTTEHGLVRVRCESYKGMLFGCFDESVCSLDAYLGDMKYYLDCFIDRREGGIEVLGGPQKWRVSGNWKMSAENQVGDNYHGKHLHAAMAPPSSVDEIFDYGRNVVPEPGHGLGLRYMPEGTPISKLFPGAGGMFGLMPSAQKYYESVHEETVQRLGELRTRLRPLSNTIFPNLSYLWPTFTIRVAHPRGPHEMEIWSWAIADRDAPDEIKKLICEQYNFTFGPSGALEQEDGVAWSGQVSGNKMRVADDRPYYYGMCLGEEGPDPELPGIVGSPLSEHNARYFYGRWRDEMARPVIERKSRCSG